jgi:hypothetical protein
VPTNRIGGLDILFSGLAVQTMPDLELLLVDDIWQHRRGIVEARAREYGLRVKHLAPIDATSGSGTYQRSLNTGLVHADGELVVILCDYTYLAPTCLERHVAFHREHANASLSGMLVYAALPKLAMALPLKYGWYAMGYDPANQDPKAYEPWLDDAKRAAFYLEWAAAYYKDLIAGRLDSVLWSVLASEITPATAPESWRVYYRERYGAAAAGIIDANQCNLKNSSFKLEHIVAMNGFDEAMDGCHVYQDSEFAGRFHARLGGTFYFDPECQAYFMDPHGVAIIRKMDRPESANLIHYQQRALAGFTGSVNDWSLLDKRKART